MKKKIILSLIISMSLVTLAGCGEEKNIKTAIDKEKQEEQSEYVVNIDDAFDSGVDLTEKKETLSPEEADFRNLKWGMTREEVVYAQGTGYRETESNKIYYTRLREEGYPCDAEYTFEDDKLSMGIFYITENKENSPVSVGDYTQLVNSLMSRFGQPSVNDYVYVSEEDKTDDAAVQLELIKNNKLQLRTGWLLEDTELRVVMFPRNGSACVGLQYKKAN